MKTHCCNNMKINIKSEDNVHIDEYECPDILISYIPKFDEYGIIVHDGGNSSIEIYFCPWCGKELPISKRDEWFDKLEKLGFDNPNNQNIPKEFKSDLWYKKLK